MMLFVMDSSLYRPGPWVRRSPEDLMERGQGCPRLGAGPSSQLPGGSHFYTPPYTEKKNILKFRYIDVHNVL